MLDVDSPNLYAPFGWQAHASTDPRGLVPIDLQSASREVRERRAEQRRREMARLLASVEGYLRPHQDDSQAQLLAGLARHLKQEGFAGQTHEAVLLATSFLGRAECTAYLECHLDMAEGAIGVMEAIVNTSAMLAFTEIATLELFSGPSLSYSSMIQQLRAEVQLIPSKTGAVSRFSHPTMASSVSPLGSSSEWGRGSIVSAAVSSRGSSLHPDATGRAGFASGNCWTTRADIRGREAVRSRSRHSSSLF